MRAPALLAAFALGCTGQIGDGEAVTGATADAAPRAADARTAADAAPLPAPDAGPPCPTVAHIGDSLTAYTVPSLTVAYQAVGAGAQIDAYGGRAVLQKLAADPKTGKQAALDFRAAGFSGCWVVALGTNDTADVATGSGYTRAHAIDEMMAAIDPTATARVLWVNTYTTLTTGYYANANMVLFNQALADATARWPGLRVFDWAAIAATGSAPYVDGIHHTTAGFTVRNQAIAAALALLGP